MPKCSNCGGEFEEAYKFCKYCGTKLNELSESRINNVRAIEDEIENFVIRRLDGLKNRNEAIIKALIDERYSKFDDWPPFRRQEAAEALRNEFGAFKVLTNYNYQIKDFESNVFNDMAIATFHLSYQGTIRNRAFDISSRVTSVFRKQGSEWKLLHEHFSRFPDETRRRFSWF